MPTGSTEDDDLDDDLEDADRNAGYAVEYGGDETFVDDDEYLEYTVSWDDEPEPVTQAEPVVHASLSCRPTTGGTPLASWGPIRPKGRGCHRADAVARRHLCMRRRHGSDPIEHPARGRLSSRLDDRARA